jgi:hypothetical protein
MEPITKDFLEEYLKPHLLLSEEQNAQWSLEISKEFEQTLPMTFKAFNVSLALLLERSQEMNLLTLKLGMLMFDIYRRFYGGFAKPERESLWKEKNRELLQMTVACDPESGVSEAKQADMLRGFVKQNTLMALFLLKVEAFVKGHPKGKPYFTEVFMYLAVLAAQLNELVGAPAPKKEPEAGKIAAKEFPKRDRHQETISEDFLKAHFEPQRHFTNAERLLWHARMESEFRQTLPRTYRAFVASLAVLQRQSKKLAYATQQLGNIMFDTYREFYGGFVVPERKGLWEQNNRVATKIMRAFNPASKASGEKVSKEMQAFARQNLLLAMLMYRVETIVDDRPEQVLGMYEVYSRLVVLAAQLNTLVGL